MGKYRWKRFEKAGWKSPVVPEGRIVISTDHTGHRRVSLGAVNVRKYFGEDKTWVELYYDEEGRAIGFKPVPKRTRNAYRMHSYEIPISGIEKEFGFQDGTYKVFWDSKNRLLVAEIEKSLKQ